jgi:hypothetical protein
MTKILEQAHDLVPGTAYARTTVDSAERVQLPGDMQNVFCVFAAETQDVWIRFGTGAVTVVLANRSTLTSEVPAEATSAPMLHVPAGQERHRRLPVGLYTHFSHISGGTDGVLRFGPATGTGIQDDT